MARAYRKKPVVVEAVQWTGNNHADMCEFIDPEVFEIIPRVGLVIHTLEGDHHASPGDYIIKGVNGEFYPCKPDIFAKTYEADLPTLTPPNEWVNRVRELDELYTKLQIITGFTVEQLLEMFAAGYTLEKPDYSKSFEEMASLAETTPPNEALTQADLDSMDYDKVWIDYGDNGEWALVVSGRIYSLAVLEGAGFEDILRDEVDGETMDRPSGDYAVYRRPPEGDEDA